MHMTDSPRFDEHGRVIPDSNLRKGFLQLARNSMFTNENKGAILAVYDLKNDNVYLATYMMTSFKTSGDRDKLQVLKAYGDEPHWVEAHRCVFIPKRLWPHMYESFPLLNYVDMNYILHQ